MAVELGQVDLEIEPLTYFEELYRWRLVPLTLTRNAYMALNACELIFAFHCYF